MNFNWWTEGKRVVTNEWVERERKQAGRLLYALSNAIKLIGKWDTYLSMRDIFFSIWLDSRTDEIDPRPAPYKITAVHQAPTLYSMVLEMLLKNMFGFLLCLRMCFSFLNFYLYFKEYFCFSFNRKKNWRKKRSFLLWLLTTTILVANVWETPYIS